MEVLADIFLFSGAIGAAFYCFILSRRLSKFNDLEHGMGGAVAVLSVQVDEMTRALAAAQKTAAEATSRVEEITGRAEEAASRLELLMASMHDVSEAPVARTGRVVRRPRRSASESAGDRVI